ncbi:hypothetical protein [Agromyces sp. SYSU T0242]|uniref:hypothetical protein n=1 Tax=Agromyces litoreus TaxID=3158561 RepID=UPI0033911237
MEPDDTATTDTTGPDATRPDPGPGSDVDHDDGPVAARPLRWWLCLLIGAAAGVVGLLPWLLEGMRLPLQNLWATDTPPDEYPLVLLPFNQYFLSQLAALLVAGGAAAGIAARATRNHRRPSGVVWTLLGLLVVQVAAIAQTATVVRDGLAARAESALYLVALVATAALALLVGVGVMLLVAATPRAGAVIGLAVAAVLAPSWLGGLLLPDPALGVDAEPALLVLRWLPAVLVGAAIAWGGIGTIGRVAAALAALAVLWIGPALITAVSSAAGSRVLARHPQEMLDYAVEVFRSATTRPEVFVPPLVVAVVVAAIGLLGRNAARRVRRTRSALGPSASGAAVGTTTDAE